MGKPPGAAPMTTPQPPAGLQEASRVNIHMATQLLQRSIAAFGVGSKEGRAILTSLKALGSAFGEQEGSTKELMPAELRKMIGEFAGPGIPGPAPGAGAPPGAPPQPGAAAPK